MNQITPASPYLRQLAAGRAALPGQGVAWLDAMREAALQRFGETGFPTPRLEDWKFTNLAPLTRTEFRPASGKAGIEAAEIAARRLEGRSHLLVFVNGRFRPDLSDLCRLPSGVVIENVADLLRTGPDALQAHLSAANGAGLPALNAALMTDGAVIRLARGAAFEWPIHLLFLGAAEAEPAAGHLRNLVLAEAGAVATIVETYAARNGAAYWSNPVTQVIVGDGASIAHYKLQAESGAAFHTALTRVELARNAAYTNFVLSSGSRLARNEIEARFAGEGVHCRLNGIALARGQQHLDHTIRLDHAKPHGSSAQIYKGVVDEQGHTVFQGRIRVAPDAQKTDAQQLNRNLLLSPTAQADAKPELEILADDVRCSHGATIGDLDKEALFYLRARGLDEHAARHLLVEAFAGELIDEIENKAVRSAFRQAFADWLKEGQV